MLAPLLHLEELVVGAGSFSSATSRKPSLLSPSAGPEWRKLIPVLGVPRWEEKIPLAKTTLEKTWLFHEIGRCYLELDQAWEAQSYGEKSQQCAEEEGDMEWQLNASVLVAQAQGTDALLSPQALLLCPC